MSISFPLDVDDNMNGAIKRLFSPGILLASLIALQIFVLTICIGTQSQRGKDTLDRGLSTVLTIDFSRPNFPNFIENIEGISNSESWGRWSEHSEKREVSIIFKSNLPNAFELQLKLSAYGPNIGKQAVVRIGDTERILTLGSGLKIYTLNFDGVQIGTRIIQIRPYQPISPNELNSSLSDTRKIGIGLASIMVTYKIN